ESMYAGHPREYLRYPETETGPKSSPGLRLYRASCIPPDGHNHAGRGRARINDNVICTPVDVFGVNHTVTVEVLPRKDAPGARIVTVIVSGAGVWTPPCAQDQIRVTIQITIRRIPARCGYGNFWSEVGV